MSANADALRLLFPIELGGAHDADLEIDARSLDAGQASAETLLTEMFPDRASSLLTDWERVLVLTPIAGTPVQSRRDQVIRKIRARGGLSIPYFKSLAASLGYDIDIIEPVPFMAGWGRAGDRLNGPAICSQWGVRIHNQPVYRFRAGTSVAGERLTWWLPQTVLEDIFRELKPAHTFVYFIYD